MVLREAASVALSMAEPNLGDEQSARYADVAVGIVESVLASRVMEVFAAPLDEARSAGDADLAHQLAVLRDSLLRSVQDDAEQDS